MLLWNELFVPQKNTLFWDLISNMTFGDGVLKKQLHCERRNFIAEISALIKRTRRNLLHFPWGEDMLRRCLLHLVKQSFSINFTESARNLILDLPVANILKNKFPLFTSLQVFYHGSIWMTKAWCERTTVWHCLEIFYFQSILSQ